MKDLDVYFFVAIGRDHKDKDLPSTIWPYPHPPYPGYLVELRTHDPDTIYSLWPEAVGPCQFNGQINHDIFFNYIPFLLVFSFQKCNNALL